jgi:hypothetical protein
LQKLPTTDKFISKNQKKAQQLELSGDPAGRAVSRAKLIFQFRARNGQRRSASARIP